MRTLKQITLTTIGLLIWLTALPQQCTEANVQSLPGKWKPAMNGSIDQSAADAAKEKMLLVDIIQTLQKNFGWAVQGGDITYNNHICNNQFSNNPLPFRKATNASEAYLFFQHYFCNNGKVYTEDFFTEFRVLINQYPYKFGGSFFIPKVDAYGNREEDPENNMYMLSPVLPQFKNGVWEYYETEIRGNSRYTNDSSVAVVKKVFRIISKPGTIPYTVMAKKEYYEGWIGKYNNDVAGYDRQIALFRDSKDPHLEAYDRKRNIELDESLKKPVLEKIKALNELLKNKTAAELAKPAISGEEEGIYYDGIRDAYTQYYVLKPNMNYYDSKLPKWKPQLVTIVFNTGGMYRGEKARNNSSEPDRKFVLELKRMNAADLITKKLQPLL